MNYELKEEYEKKVTEMDKAFDNLIETTDEDEQFRIHDFFFRETLGTLYSRDRKKAGVMVEKLENFAERANKMNNTELEEMFYNLSTLVTLAYEIPNLADEVDEEESKALKEDIFRKEWKKYKKEKF